MQSQNQAHIAQKEPYIIEVVEGTNYQWCACGQSKKQPFCDGRHLGTDFTPIKYEAKASKKVYFCGCKQSKNGVLCDGTHKNL